MGALNPVTGYLAGFRDMGMTAWKPPGPFAGRATTAAIPFDAAQGASNGETLVI